MLRLLGPRKIVLDTSQVSYSAPTESGVAPLVMAGAVVDDGERNDLAITEHAGTQEQPSILDSAVHSKQSKSPGRKIRSTMLRRKLHIRRHVRTRFIASQEREFVAFGTVQSDAP